MHGCVRVFPTFKEYIINKLLPSRAQCACDDGGGFDDNMTSRKFSEYCTCICGTQQLLWDPFNSLQRLAFLQE